MLVLTRKTDEEILINKDILIKIISVSDGKVKLGISAPENIKIFRGEIYEKVKELTVEATVKIKETPAIIAKLKINKIES